MEGRKGRICGIVVKLFILANGRQNWESRPKIKKNGPILFPILQKFRCDGLLKRKV